MPTELINANPTVISASAIPSRTHKTSADPFQELLASYTAPDEWDASSDDDDKYESFDPQEIYGTNFHRDYHLC